MAFSEILNGDDGIVARTKINNQFQEIYSNFFNKSTGHIESLLTAETDTALVLKPDGLGGISWGAGSASLPSVLNGILISDNAGGAIASADFTWDDTAKEFGITANTIGITANEGFNLSGYGENDEGFSIEASTSSGGTDLSFSVENRNGNTAGFEAGAVTTPSVSTVCQLFLENGTSGNRIDLDLTENNIQVNPDSVRSFTGIRYGFDFGANATARDVIDKGNVVDLIPLNTANLSDAVNALSLNNQSYYCRINNSYTKKITSVKLPLTTSISTNTISVIFYDSAGTPITNGTGTLIPSIIGGFQYITIDLTAPITLTGGNDYWFGIHQASGAGASFIRAGTYGLIDLNRFENAALGASLPTGTVTSNRIIAQFL